MSQILRIFEKLALTVGDLFFKVLGDIYIEMMETYKVYSEYISSEVMSKGASVMGFTQIKKMRTVRSDILKLVTTSINQTSPQSIQAVANTLVTPSLNLLEDYAKTNPNSRYEISLVGPVIILIVNLRYCCCSR